MHYVIGTAGHIDHGKSALIKALTGTDPDRLKEEKERGMTTDLGFAFWGDDITFIDVPGHERFVRHMVAGASTIDMVILVVAGDDGVMPQTKEHFEICRLLGIKKGVIVINKIDLIDKDLLELVRAEVLELVQGSFLENAPIVGVSAKTGEGIPELKETIRRLLIEIEPKSDRGVFRLPIDRCFTVKGFGTVVAGTVLSGCCRVGDRLELLPQGVEVRVRGIQKHNKPAEIAITGERAALNLQGIEHQLVERGAVLATPNYYRPTTSFNAVLNLLKNTPKPLRNMTRVHLHIGTAEVMCRVCLLDKKELLPQEKGYVQIRCEKPVVCDLNDHFVIRHFAPQETIGGGVVLEPNAPKVKRFHSEIISRLQELEKSEEKTAVLKQFLLNAYTQIPPIPVLARDLRISEEKVRETAETLIGRGEIELVKHEGKEYYLHQSVIEKAQEAIKVTLSDFHQKNPFRLGMKIAELRAKVQMAPLLFEVVLKRLISDQDVVVENQRVRKADHQLHLTVEEKNLFDQVAKLFEQAKWRPPAPEEVFLGVNPRVKERVKSALLDLGVLVDIGEGVWMHSQAVKEAEEIIKSLFAQKNELTAAEVREALNTTRKFTLPLLNYFDSIGLTQRKGDVRILKERKG